MNPWLQLVAFFCIALYFGQSKTYLILLAAAIINLVLYFNTSDSTPWLVASYSVLDTRIALLLFRFGDRVKIYQCCILLLAAVVHFCMQVDLSKGSSVVFDNYVLFISVITALQMIGAVIDGILNCLSGGSVHNTGRAEYYYFSHKHGQRS